MSKSPRDFLERARVWSATGMFIAAALLVAGSFLDWISIAQLPEHIPSNQAHRAPPFNGFDVGDGFTICVAAIVVAVCAMLLVLKAKGGYAWTGLVASIVAGGIAISDYRGIDALFVELEGIGRGVDPGVGLTLVAGGAFLGLIAAVAGVAATPSARLAHPTAIIRSIGTRAFSMMSGARVTSYCPVCSVRRSFAGEIIFMYPQTAPSFAAM